MNVIVKGNLSDLGYNFIERPYLPEGKHEYYLRDEQHQRQKSEYRQLSAYEIEVLVKNANTSDDWTKIYVTEKFNPKLVKRCQFYGMVRIGALENYYLEFHDMKAPVGLYDSTIISCDLGDNVVINNVKHLSHYIIGNSCILININEMTTSNRAKFGNGILKDGEQEKVRVELEICNENRGRSVLAFDGMLTADAYIWSKFRDDKTLMKRLKDITDRSFDSSRGYYGVVKDRSVIKNCLIVKDVNVGSDAYIKGSNKLKNLTVNSSADEKTQIGEGTELVNGIIGYGCRIFYGVKAVRFITGTNSSLKYGARLINSFLGENATVSCCEVLNSLIYPSHEQHHNNSFLCAATLMGQSNLAAGATIGSNHNSRSNDGEIVAGRGFWPGLCVSLKHNSKFPSFTLISKGDYPAEINLKIPFSLLINNESDCTLQIMPAYWFNYNMYALGRNSWKYGNRDKRKVKLLNFEFDYLAPDTVNEMFEAISLFERYVGENHCKLNSMSVQSSEELIEIGKNLLEKDPDYVRSLRIYVDDIESGRRKAEILKLVDAYIKFKELIQFYGVKMIFNELESSDSSLIDVLVKCEITKRRNWTNLGGQLVPSSKLEDLIARINSEDCNSWSSIHTFYKRFADEYNSDKLIHAIRSLKDITGIEDNNELVLNWSTYLKEMKETIITNADLTYASRKKDYTDPFRKMTFENDDEMEEVIGKLEDNEFINVVMKEKNDYIKSINRSIEALNSVVTIDK